MTLEGIGIVMDPNFSFFDVAKPFAKEFMLKREGRRTVDDRQDVPARCQPYKMCRYILLDLPDADRW
jgi:predicted unusual protein kinase regulating ubiquinone biosynthesis (AarF/ABC1/UbiB family)